VICFDTKNNKKRDSSKRYKANRSGDVEAKGNFYARLTVLQEFLNNFWDLAWEDGEEADDVIHTLALESSANGKEVLIYSNDNDLLQCVDDKAKIKVLKSHESSLYVYDEAKVQEKYGVPLFLLVLYRSFVGDKSDNLDGVPRIQKKKLADALLTMIARLGRIGSDGELLNPIEVATAIHRHTSWSVGMSMKISDFILEGLWKENYDLMKLQTCPVEYFIKHREVDEKFVVEKLIEWEIGSLRLCEPYKQHLVADDAEF
jgi:hypothetical protein